MSVQAMTWAFEQRHINDSNARYVLLALANYADKDGRGAFPSTDSLVDDTGLSRRTVQTKLDVLESTGVIRRGNQAIAAAYIGRPDRRPVVYDLVMERGEAVAPGSERGANGAATGCKSRTNGVQMAHERGAAVAPNPSLNHQGSEERGACAPRAAKAERFDPLTARPSNVSPDAWGDWCQHRREIRKPLTPASCRHQAKQLADHPNPDHVLNLSIANGWTGLFPEKVHASSQQPRAAGRASAVDQVRAAIEARAAAEAASGAAGQPLAEDDRDVRAPLDGEFWHVG